MSSGRMTLFGLPLDTTASARSVVHQLAQEAVLLAYLNPYAWQVSRRFRPYREDLERMDIIVCDGLLVQRAARRVLGLDVPILTPDYSGIAAAFLGAFRDQGRSIVLVGGRGPTVEDASERIRADFPGIDIIGKFSGFDEGPVRAVDYIVQTRPDLVLAGMGMGLQEQFLLQCRDQGWQGSGICVGAFFDRLANPAHDYPAWSKRRNLRYLGNITRRPFYYLKRYGVDYWPFLKQYVAHRLGWKGKS